jgi:hypothetical protein
MKFIYNKIALGLLVMITGAACKKDYLQTTPTDQVATETAFSSTKNAWAALNGIHRTMYSQIFGVQAQGGQSGNMLYMDVLGEDMVHHQTIGCSRNIAGFATAMRQAVCCITTTSFTM